MLICFRQGKVLFWSRADNTQAIPCELWDPATNTFASVPEPGANVFCSGHAFLAEGRLLQAGGHIQSYFGLISAYIYSPFTNSWTRLPDMNNPRWYPTQHRASRLQSGSAVDFSAHTYSRSIADRGTRTVNSSYIELSLTKRWVNRQL